MRLYISFLFLLHLVIVTNIDALSSPIPPFTEYMFAIELLPETVDLCWNVDLASKMVTFELHMKTTGWIGLGISPNGGMTGADIGIGWVNSTGGLTFQDRHAAGNQAPTIDDTTIDWFGLQGREQDGWTAIQFERLIDTCDSMDVPIKSGSNILIFAWDAIDPDATDDDIGYHFSRRGSIVVPLLSYSQPPVQEELDTLKDVVDFRASDYMVSQEQSTYYCEVFKVPDWLPEKKHAIAREIVLQSNKEDGENLVYHLSLIECSSEAIFDDNSLPRGMCDANIEVFSQCAENIVIAWGKGGNRLVKFPEEAGLPIGLDFSVKYYMLHINYHNGEGVSNNVDTSGVRLYIGNELRENELGGLTFSVHALPSSIVVPPNMPLFSIDSYCGADVSQSNVPESGLTFFSVFGHTHTQGKSVWTKVIRNGAVVDYLFNAEAYNPDHQFQHQLLQPVQVYPGDEFAFRCAYQTIGKSDVTLGGISPSDEMCTQVFNYYPRMDNLYICTSGIDPVVWQDFLDVTTPVDEMLILSTLQSISWTSQVSNDMQQLFNNASRLVYFGRAGNYNVSNISSLPPYEDLNIDQCEKEESTTSSTGAMTTTIVTTITSTVTSTVQSTSAPTTMTTTTSATTPTSTTTMTTTPTSTTTMTTTPTSTTTMTTTPTSTTSVTMTSTTTVTDTTTPATTVTETTTPVTTVTDTTTPATTVTETTTPVTTVTDTTIPATTVTETSTTSEITEEVTTTTTTTGRGNTSNSTVVATTVATTVGGMGNSLDIQKAVLILSSIILTVINGNIIQNL